MSKQASPALVAMWQEMADLTLKKCGPDTCRTLSPTRCCSPEYCDMAIDIAKREHGIELKTTGHPTLPLMDPTGCTAAPHLRPLCSLHQCAICSIGSLASDLPWTRRYYKLREKLDLRMTQEQYDNESKV